MKNTVSILKHIFVPLSAFAFLIFGLMACFCSGLIEYLVLRELLSLPEHLIAPDLWATLIVFVLEGSKFTLHFYYASLKRKDFPDSLPDFDAKTTRQTIGYIKNILMLFSLFCSIICFTNVLYPTSQHNRLKNAEKQQKEEISAELNDETTRLNAEKESYITTHTQTYDYEKHQIEYLNNEHARILELIATINSSARRKTLQQEADALESRINNLERTYIGHLENVQQQAQTEFETQLQEYKNTLIKPLSDTDQLAILAASDNTYLSNCLMVFSETIFNHPYSRSTYLICAMIISLIVSILLELCINICQSLLTIDVDTFMKILGNMPPIRDSALKFVSHIRNLIFGTLISASMYLVFCILFANNIEVSNLFLALITYLVSSFFLNQMAAFPSKRKNASENTSAPEIYTVAHKIFSEIQNIIIPGAICFIGYSIIGFFCNGTFIYGDMNGLAIALGGAVSHRLHYMNCNA